MRKEQHCKQVSLACVGSAHSVWATLGLSPLTASVLSRSTLLRFQVALQGNSLKQPLDCVHFPGLSHSGSGSQVFHKGRLGWACVLCPSQVQAAEATRCLASVLSPGGWRILSPPWSQPLGFLGVQWEHCPRCAMCLLWGELISGCDPPGRCQPSGSQEDLVSNWKPAHSLVEDTVSGAEISPRLLTLAVACLPLCLQ